MNKPLGRALWAALALLLILTGAVGYRMIARQEDRWVLTGSTRTLENPGRGFYIQVDSARTDKIPDLARQVRVILLAFDIGEYTDAPLPRDKLAELDDALRAADQAHLSVVFRAAYGFCPDVREPEDPALIDEHIAQIAGVLNRWSHRILTVQAGMLGDYGEWHDGRYLGGGELPDREYRLYVLQSWQDHLDGSIQVAVRRPRFIREARAAGILDGRLGLHNDALLSTQSDMGTYDDPDYSFERELAWMDGALDEVYNGGEMPALSERSQPDNAHRELAALHLSYLNLRYNEDVLDAWRGTDMPGAPGQTAFDYIERHLGYRLWVTRITAARSLLTDLIGPTLDLSLSLQNDGYAALPPGYRVYLELYDEAGTRLQWIELDRSPLNRVCGGSQATLTVRLEMPGALKDGPLVLGLRIAPDTGTAGPDCVELANDPPVDYRDGCNWLLRVYRDKDAFGDPVRAELL